MFQRPTFTFSNLHISRLLQMRSQKGRLKTTSSSLTTSLSGFPYSPDSSSSSSSSACFTAIRKQEGGKSLTRRRQQFPTNQNQLLKRVSDVRVSPKKRNGNRPAKALTSSETESKLQRKWKRVDKAPFVSPRTSRGPSALASRPCARAQQRAQKHLRPHPHNHQRQQHLKKKT